MEWSDRSGALSGRKHRKTNWVNALGRTRACPGEGHVFGDTCFRSYPRLLRSTMTR